MKLTREQAIELLMVSELDKDGELVISGIDVDPPYLRHQTPEYQDVDGRVISAQEFHEELGDIVTRMPFVTPPPEFGGCLATIDEKLFWVGGREGLKAQNLVRGISVKIAYIYLVSGLCAILSYRLDRAKLERTAKRTWKDLHQPSCPPEESAELKH
jgi:hypothetical protein